MGARFPNPSGMGFAGMTVWAEVDTATLKQDEAHGPAPTGDARPPPKPLRRDGARRPRPSAASWERSRVALS